MVFLMVQNDHLFWGVSKHHILSICFDYFQHFQWLALDLSLVFYNGSLGRRVSGQGLFWVGPKMEWI
jgi:hypothetical protein